jgi:hypothetical protein
MLVWAVMMILIVFMMIIIIVNMFGLEIPVVALFNGRRRLCGRRLRLLLRSRNECATPRLGYWGIGAASGLAVGGRVDGIAASVPIASLGDVGDDQFMVDAAAEWAVSRLSFFNPALTCHDTGAGCALAARRR